MLDANDLLIYSSKTNFPKQLLLSLIYDGISSTQMRFFSYKNYAYI